MTAIRGSSVAVIAAMAAELHPIIRALRLAPVSLGDLRAHEGTVAGHRIVAVVTSMGTRAAVDITTRLLDARAVDHVLVVGICGGIDPNVPIGALVVPSETVMEDTGRIGRPVAIGGCLPTGRLLTTDRLHTDPAEVAALHQRGFVAVDMESGAIGGTCEERGIPWSVFRAVSDRAGDPVLDAELMAMSAADGRPRPRAVAAYVLRHPRRVPRLAALGAGMRKAVAASTGAALAALQA